MHPSVCNRQATLILSTWLGAALFLLTPSLFAQPPRLPIAEPASCGIDSSRLSRIDALVEEAIQEKKMPGAVVLVGHQGKVVLHKAYGNRQIEPETLPMLPDTLFDMASITKPVATATSVMILVERGVIKLRDKVADHIPEFANNGKADVTIEQLLLHTAGLVPDNAMSDYAGTPEDSIRNLMNVDLKYPPGSDFRYSDVGFLVLGELIRRKTGEDVHQFSKKNIFEPLGMKETGYLPPEDLKARAAPTEKREDKWIQGEVHDPRAFALGGIAGHAGLFSSASDIAIYAQMMIQQGEYGGVRILSPQTVRLMTQAQQVPKGQRALGWDKRSGYSSNRGETMTDSAFGHGGFTGTVLWIDPELELFVVFLSNRVHPDGKGLVNPLAGKIGTIAASSIIQHRAHRNDSNTTSVAFPPGETLAGIDVLARENFSLLKGKRVGLITNHTGISRSGETTIELLHKAPEVKLAAIFSPEHGIAGKLDQETIGDLTDPLTGVPIFSLYGANRVPTEESLKDIDTLVFDIQDIGTRFYTYISTMGGAMEAAGRKEISFVVLDRPNPINGYDTAGPVLDAGTESFVGYHTIALRHGMTAGELAKMMWSEKHMEVDLQIVKCQGWDRKSFFESTGLRWINPSPNMRNLNQALLYPGVGMIEYTNLSVGRGTDTPFEHIGAPWLDPFAVSRELNKMELPGVCFIPERFTPTSSKFEKEECGGVQILITDRAKLQPVRVGLAIAVALRKIHPDQWDTTNLYKLVGSQKVLEAIERNDSLDIVYEQSLIGLNDFMRRRQQFLMY